MCSMLKKSASQCLLRDIMKFIVDVFYSISSRLLLKIQVIKITGSVNNLFWTWSIKSTHLSKEEPLKKNDSITSISCLRIKWVVLIKTFFVLVFRDIFYTNRSILKCILHPYCRKLVKFQNAVSESSCEKDNLKWV